MKVRELSKRLQLEDTNKPIVLYFLRDYTLNRCELETIIEVDGQVEMTIKPYNTDEGGNKIESEVE